MFKSLLPWKHTKTKVMVPEQTMEDETKSKDPTLVPCATCGRTFLPLPLRKHAPICEKNASKKRRVFDSLKQRVEGTDLAQFHQKTYLKKQESTPKLVERPKKAASRWEENHQMLVDAIRSAKGATREMSPPPKKVPSTTSTSSNERCPHCERQFGPKAFDRHVEWCKEHRTRVQKSPANVLIAKERLEARIKYKVPPLNKAKKLTIKEKYSGSNVVSRADSVCSVKSTPPNLLRRTPSVKKPKSVLDLGRQPTRAEDTNKSTTSTTPYDPFVSAERQLMELLECDTVATFNTTTAAASKPQHSLRPHTTAANKSGTAPAAKKPSAKSAAPAAATNKRASVIDPPACFQDADDDFEMLENLINDEFNSVNDDDADAFFLSLNNKRNKDDFNVSMNRRRRQYSDDASSVDSNLINDNDNLSIPEHFKFGNYSSDDTDTTIQNNDDDVDFYSVRYDKKIEPPPTKKGGGGGGGNSSVKKSPTFKPKTDSSFGKGDSKAAHVRRRTKETESSAKTQGKGGGSKTKTKEKAKKVSESSESDFSIKPEDLFAVDDKMYAEYKIYEEMYLKEKELAASTKKQRAKNAIKSYGIEITSDEPANLPTESVSNDSAYGSLNRNSPTKTKTTRLLRMDSASSGCSEKNAPAPAVGSQPRLSKFCHECGNKFPLETAKFCVECGVKRLLL